MVDLVHSLTIPMPFYLALNAYYASKVIVHGLLHSGNHLITRVRKNAVAYWPALPSSEKRRGPKRKYGAKVKLKSLFQDVSSFIEAPSPAYGETHVILRYRPIDLLWRPVGIVVRFILVIHPKMRAYHCHMQLGIIAQGLLQYHMILAFPLFVA